MKRVTALAALVVVLTAGALLGGCVLPKGGGSKAAPALAKAGTPHVGTHALQRFMPQSAVIFSDGIAALGVESPLTPDKESLPATLRSRDATNWDAQTFGTTLRYPHGASELGPTRVIIGGDGSTGSPLVPFIAVSTNGGQWAVRDVGQSIFAGKSAELNSIARTGEPGSSTTRLMTVGGTVSSQNGEIGGAGSVPVAFTSVDGNAWQPTADLPLPAGVTGAEAWDVTYAASGTAYPGVIVVGTGTADDKQLTLRNVGIVWQSTDMGKTWKIISAEDFDQDGRNMAASFVTSDNKTILVAGVADVSGQKGGSDTVKQTTAIDWAAGSDGQWHASVDTLEPNRSSMTTVLLGIGDGGFLTATTTYDKGSSLPSFGQALKGDPAAHAWYSADGVNFTDLTPSIKDMDTAAVINGIAESEGRSLFFGMDGQGHSVAYVVDTAKAR